MTRVRKTIQRAMILEAVMSLDHPTIEQVYEKVRHRHPHIGKVTVYRNLTLLAQEGIISAVHLPVPPQRYDGRTSPHYHFRCRQCGGVTDVETEQDFEEAVNSRIKIPAGTRVETHGMSFAGLCSRCHSGQREC